MALLSHNDFQQMQLQCPPTHPLVVARSQVALPKGAFIRALPFTVDETQRFRIEALVLSAEIVASTYVQMAQVGLMAKGNESENESMHSGANIAFFQHAWTMVDQVYSLRRLIRSLGFKGDDVNAFMSVTESAVQIRNRMDHLDQLIPNIAKSKDKSRSLFGSLSYFVLGAAVGSPEVDVFAVTQNAGPNRPGETIGSIKIPSELRMPIGNFVLSAAGNKLDLDATILTLGPVMIRTNEGFEKSIRARAAEKAAEHGIPESDILAHQGAGLRVMLTLKINETTGQVGITENDKESNSPKAEPDHIGDDVTRVPARAALAAGLTVTSGCAEVPESKPNNSKGS